MRKIPAAKKRPPRDACFAFGKELFHVSCFPRAPPGRDAARRPVPGRDACRLRADRHPFHPALLALAGGRAQPRLLCQHFGERQGQVGHPRLPERRGGGGRRARLQDACRALVLRGGRPADRHGGGVRGGGLAGRLRLVAVRPHPHFGKRRADGGLHGRCRPGERRAPLRLRDRRAFGQHGQPPRPVFVGGQPAFRGRACGGARGGKARPVGAQHAARPRL